MTSREMLALAAVGAPGARRLSLVAVAPRRVVQPSAIAGLVVAGGARDRARRRRARRRPESRGHGDWFVVDAAGGLMVGVIGVVGLASVLVSPALPRDSDAGLFGARRGTRCVLRCACRVLGVLLAVPLAGNLGAAWLLVEATTAASAILVGFSGKPRALEAGWKYLILTSLGLGVALLGIVLLAAGAPGGALGALSWRSLLGTYVPAERDDARRLPAAARRSRREDRLGAGPQLAPGRPLRGAAARLGAALGGAAAGRAARRLALERALGPASASAPARAVLIAFGLVSLAVAIPFLWRSLAWKRLLAYSSLEHMGVIALGDRVRDAARSRRRRRPHRRARRREGARLLRRDAAAGSRAPRGRPRRDGDRADAARRSARRWASRSARSRGCRRRRSSSARS